MEGIGEAVKWIGLALAALGIASMALWTILMLLSLVRRREFHPRVGLLVFRSQLVVVLGIQIAVLGLMLSGRLPWLFLIGIVLFGLPALIALGTRIEVPRRPPPSN